MKCKKCGGKAIKYGKKKYQQIYKCKNCKYKFHLQTKARKTEEGITELLGVLNHREFAYIDDICEEYDVSIRSVKRWMSEYKDRKFD